MRLLRLSVASAILLVAFGCGGGSTPTAHGTIASGNWTLLLLSNATPPLPLALGGSLMQQGNNISGLLHVPDSPCFDPLLDDVVVNGTVDGQTLTLSSVSVRGQTITMSAILPIADSVSLLKGSYTSGGSTCIGASGTVAAFLVPPLTGTFSGQVTGSFTSTVTANLTQTGPDAHGFFHLSGDFSFSGSPCFSSGTVTSSSLSGRLANFAINTNDGGQIAVAGLNLMIGLTNNLGVVLIVQSGTCAGFAGNGTLVKQ